VSGPVNDGAFARAVGGLTAQAASRALVLFQRLFAAVIVTHYFALEQFLAITIFISPILFINTESPLN
jgi:hypothetical protein